LLQGNQQYRNSIRDPNIIKRTKTMSLDDELSKIEAVVSACEKELKNQSFSATAIADRMRSIADSKARTAKGNELSGWLAEKCETVDIERLLELRDQNPDDPRINGLGRRAVNYCAALQDITLSVIQTLDSPNSKTAAAKNQAAALIKVMARIRNIFSGAPPAPAPPTLPPAAAE
jgi:hypothetical protein